MTIHEWPDDVPWPFKHRCSVYRDGVCIECASPLPEDAKVTRLQWVESEDAKLTRLQWVESDPTTGR